MTHVSFSFLAHTLTFVGNLGMTMQGIIRFRVVDDDMRLRYRKRYLTEQGSCVRSVSTPERWIVCHRVNLPSSWYYR